MVNLPIEQCINDNFLSMYDWKIVASDFSYYDKIVLNIDNE